MTDNSLLIGLIVVVAILAVALWMFSARRRHQHLRERFGPEYDRTVGTTGSTGRAEAALLEREKRVSKYQIRALTHEERTRFTDTWQRVQAQFVDDPAGAVTEADVLVTELMTTRGYPMSDWDQRVDDLSVDHANVVHHYREAREIASRHARGAASTEDLRQAVVHYRALFTDLLDDASTAPAAPVPEKRLH
jgi:hypothetical protein